MFEFCAVGNPCLLQDYDAFLTVAFAVNISISAWWALLRNHIDLIARTKVEQNRSKLPKDVALDEGRRSECERTVQWLGRLVGIFSGLMALVIGVALLLLRSNTPICFWCVCFSIISLVFLLFISIYYRGRMNRIDKDEKIFLAGVDAAENTVKSRSSALASNLD